MTTLRNALFAAAVLYPGAALQPAARDARATAGLDADVVSDRLRVRRASGGAARLDRLDAGPRRRRRRAISSFDAFITLGALALAGAATAGFAAVAARRTAEEARSGRR